MVMKKTLGNICLFLLISVICFGALEVFFRTTHFLGARISWANADPLLGWRMAPGHYWYLHENDKPVQWRANRYGWRGPDWSLSKPEGTYRVAVLGDSYVEALQVEEDKTFLPLTEKIIRAQTGRDVELMNFGRSCNTQSEELLILKNEIFKFNPDMVVLFYFAVNDIDDLHPSTALSLMRPFYSQTPQGELVLDDSFNQTVEYRLKKNLEFFKHHSALISLMAERLVILQRTWRARKTGILQADAQDTKQLKAYLSLMTDSPDPRYLENYRLSKRLIREMAAECRRRGIRFLLVNIDLPSYVPAVEKQFKEAAPSFDGLFFDRDLEDLAETEGIEFLGLEQPFRRYHRTASAFLHFKYWDTLGTQGYWEYGAHTGHWNYAGHQLVAQELASKILSGLPSPAGQTD